MLEKFSNDSMKIIFAAKKAARKDGRKRIETVDILIAAAGLQNDVSKLLSKNNITAAKIEDEYKKIKPPPIRSREMFSKDTVKVFIKALKIINSENEEKVTPLHLLRAIILEKEEITKTIFDVLGANTGNIINEAEKILKSEKRVTGIKSYKDTVILRRNRTRKEAFQNQYLFLLKLFGKI